MEVLDLEVKSLDFVEEIASQEGGEGIRSCFACGTCSAGCPVRRFQPSFNPRRIIRMVLLGLREEVLGDPFIWFCATCYTCQERCPQGVRVTDIMRALRNLAMRYGNIPEGFAMQFQLLWEKGSIYPLDEFDNKKRVKAGLPEFPLAGHDLKALLEDLRRIFNKNRDF